LWWINEQRREFDAAFQQLSNGPRPKTLYDVDPSLGVDFTPCEAGDSFADFMRETSEAPKFYALGYQDVYGPICACIEGPDVQILEIGIGVNDPSAPSGMPSSHQPGASLRGWLQRFPTATVHGADVDPRALITDGTFAVHHVDQRNSASLQALARQLPQEFSLIVDDGLHTAEANAKTAVALLPLLRQGGFLVVEDILPEYWNLWEALPPKLPQEYAFTFLGGTELRSQSNSGIAVFRRIG
jgi:hypothetical protein